MYTSDLPIRLGSISAAVDVSLERCRLENPPPAVVSRGWPAVRAELKAEFEEYEAWHAEQVIFFFFFFFGPAACGDMCVRVHGQTICAPHARLRIPLCASHCRMLLYI